MNMAVTWMTDAIKECGAAQCGALSLDVLRPWMSVRAQKRAEQLCPDPAGVLIGAFPYFSGRTAGNLSVYARGLDYHVGVTHRLDEACRKMSARFPKNRFVPMVDASPLPERMAAQLSGIGILGYHGLVMCPPYGSYVFLGAVLTDHPIPNKAQPVRRCSGCRNCIRACPSGALSVEDGQVRLDIHRCLSHLTQKKQPLTEEEQEQVRAHPYVWGCDLCQLACPENRAAARSSLPELTGREPVAPYLHSLTGDLLADLDEHTFQQKYGNRAFAWRGLQILKRNLDLQQNRNQENSKK